MKFEEKKANYTYLRTNGAVKLDGTPATFGSYTFTLTKDKITRR